MYQNRREYDKTYRKKNISRYKNYSDLLIDKLQFPHTLLTSITSHACDLAIKHNDNIIYTLLC